MKPIDWHANRDIANVSLTKSPNFFGSPKGEEEEEEGERERESGGGERMRTGDKHDNDRSETNLCYERRGSDPSI